MAPLTGTTVGQVLAKGLGIKQHYRNPTRDPVSRGESVFSVSTADTFVEKEPTSKEWLQEVLPSRGDILCYFYNLFPFLHWIGRYNLQWFIGDLVAGITVGAVVVPQSMAYATLAQLPPQFGLYSSFMGVLIYWFFATSKDITIGPVAVMSAIMGDFVLKWQKEHPEVPGHVMASALAVIAGSIITFIGLIRCGWIVDFISLTAISAFMTGSALNIIASQVPTLMGITGFNTRDATYQVVINILKHLNGTKLDAAMGLTSLTMLYLIRSFATWMARKQPNQRKKWFFISTLRTAFVILLYVMISWLVNRQHREKPLFKILQDVPRGFQNVGVPIVTESIIQNVAGELPASVIVLLIEHIAISKSFGRVNHYTINPSQELVAIGITNLFGPFFGAYPATGSFSRTAIKSKAGVRTPFAGVITAIVVLLAIYALPAVFFYIPSALLAAVIIHAVGDLITPPSVVYQFWQISPIDVLIFFAGVFVTVFSTIENGIYTTICVSLAIILFRLAKARGRFLGKVKIYSVVGDYVAPREGDGKEGAFGSEVKDSLRPTNPNDLPRHIFLPIDHRDGSNPVVEVDNPYPGVFIYRFSEGFNYPNASHYLDHLTNVIFKETRKTDLKTYLKPGACIIDRPWNDPGPRRGKEIDTHDTRPTLKAVIIDFSSVNNVDITSIQVLIDVRNQLDRYASPDEVQWHFAAINNRWTKRALASAGFGYPTPKIDSAQETRWKPIFSVAELGGSSSAAQYAEYRENEEIKSQKTSDLEMSNDQIKAPSSKPEGSDDFKKGLSGKDKLRVAIVNGLNRPFFHTDLTSALRSAIENIEAGHGVVSKVTLATALDLQEH